jgi:hypothetical protein
MSFSDLLAPRQDVLSEEGIEGIIDLENLRHARRRKLESRPADFLELTYPTTDVQRLVQKLHDRFAGSGDAPGLFLMEGLKGSGKSHMLLLAYHLLKSQSAARTWLATHGIQCALPEDIVVVVNKFTDFPLYSIWDFVFEQLTGRTPATSVVQPSLDDVQRALGGRRLVLIFDELEQGIRVITDHAVKAQNIAFLQMLSEWSTRSDQVTMLASIYSDQEEPGSTLKRVQPHVRIRFEHSSDQSHIVLHRLFENYLTFDHERAAPVVDSYLNLWARHFSVGADDYRSRLLECYPFLPELLELILRRVPARGGFQSVRGALGFLANMVRLSHERADIVTAAHAPLSDREVAARLSDLDTSGDLVRKARMNADEIAQMGMPLAGDIAATAMLYTLTSSGRMVGATRDELLKHVLRPGVDINDFERALLAFQKFAAHFHLREGRYYFDLEENTEAKVEYESLRVDAGDPSNTNARRALHTLWRDEIFREPASVVFTDVEETKAALQELDASRLRYVLAPRRLSADERHLLFHGVANRNQVILLEPRDDSFNLDQNADLIKWAQREIAAQRLSGMTDDAQRRAEYERIGRTDHRNCVDAIRRAGLVFIRWEHYGATSDEDRVEEENLPGDGSKDRVLEALAQQHFPVQLFEEHIRDRLGEVKGRSVRDVELEYRQTLGWPVPTTVRTVSTAIRNLCRDRHLGIRHPGGNFCGENPSLTETEISSATIDEPFEAGVTVGFGGRQPIGAGQGAGPGGAPPPTGSTTTGGTSVITPPRTESIAILPQPSAGALRQEIAARLQGYENPTVVRANFTVYLTEEAGDLASLPAAIRGSLGGPGSLSADIRIQKEGEFSKAEVEQMAESLPSLPRADYSARLEVSLPGTEDQAPEGTDA